MRNLQSWASVFQISHVLILIVQVSFENQNIEIFLTSGLSFLKSKDSKMFWNACTQAAIRFFYTKIRNFLILPKRSFVFYSEIRNFTVIPKRPFAFYSEMQNSENCTQTAIRFSHQNKKFGVEPRLPFILWLENKKFSKFFRNSNLLFDSKLKNLKLHPNCHSLFESEIQNTKVIPKRPFVFLQKTTKIEP